MDAERFDTLTRAWGAGTSRRQVLRLLLAGTLLGWRPRLARAAGTCTAEQAAACDAAGQSCCNDVCTPGYDADPNNCGACGNVCGDGETCAGGACAPIGCAGDAVYCPSVGACTDPSADPFNCGGCGIVCDSGECTGGICVTPAPACEPGLAFCETFAACLDLSSNVTNCGACDRSCPNFACYACVGGECVPLGDGEPCQGGGEATGGTCCGGDCFQPENLPGACGGGGCGDGLTDCGDGVCVDPASDVFNCGGCGQSCSNVACFECVAGTCSAVANGAPCFVRGGAEGVCCAGDCYFGDDEPPAFCFGCDEGFADCGGTCTEVTADPDNCGDCGVICADNEQCFDGACGEIGCDQDAIYCRRTGGCTDGSIDPSNCGACGVVCGDGEACDGGECVVPDKCRNGLTGCDGTCVDLDADPNNCGDCGFVCARNADCTRGECVCQEGSDYCADVGACFDLSSDAENCGACGVVCNEGDGCRDGTCEAPAAEPTAARTPTAPKLAWPFDPEEQGWAIVNGYRGADDHAPRPDGSANYALFALDLAKCRGDAVDDAAGTCDLGPDGDDWDREGTRGASVLSPVDGTVAWIDESDPPCLGFAIDIDDAPGYRLALFHVEGYPERGRVKRGEPIGRVAEGGCTPGDYLHLVLYKTTAQEDEDDRPDDRRAIPFAGDWAIGTCTYRDDKKTTHQHRGRLVPCRPDDAEAAMTTPAS